MNDRAHLYLIDSYDLAPCPINQDDGSPCFFEGMTGVEILQEQDGVFIVPPDVYERYVAAAEAMTAVKNELRALIEEAPDRLQPLDIPVISDYASPMTTSLALNPATLAMNSHPAKSVQDATAGKPAVIEPKYDGIRLLVHRTETGVEMFARSGKSKSGKLPAIDAELFENLPAGTWLDGEAVSFNTDGTQNWGGAQSVLGSSVTKAALMSGSIRFVVFDLIAHGGLDARSLPFSARRELLESVFAGATFERVMLSPTVPATEEAHEANLEAGFEGSMVKLLSGTYASGKRVRWSAKLKATDTVDVIVTGFKPGKPGSWIEQAGMIGAIEFAQRADDGTMIQGACSGMSAALRRTITDNAADMVGTVIEVSYMTRMPGGKLRHPQFQRIREDKTAAEVMAG